MRPGSEPGAQHVLDLARDDLDAVVQRGRGSLFVLRVIARHGVTRGPALLADDADVEHRIEDRGLALIAAGGDETFAGLGELDVHGHAPVLQAQHTPYMRPP